MRPASIFDSADRGLAARSVMQGRDRPAVEGLDCQTVGGAKDASACERPCPPTMVVCLKTAVGTPTLRRRGNYVGAAALIVFSHRCAGTKPPLSHLSRQDHLG